MTDPTPPLTPPPDRPPAEAGVNTDGRDHTEAPDCAAEDGCSPGPMLESDLRDIVDRARLLATGAAGPDQISDDGLEDLAVTLESARRALDAATARINGEIDARKSTDRRHGHSTKTWTAGTLRLPSEEAGRRVKVARLLRSCPDLHEALRLGRIGFDHVRVIANATNARNVDAVIGIQQQLIDMTDDFLLFRAWAAQVLDLLRLADPDGAEPSVEDNHLNLSVQFDGSARLEATLVGDSRHVVEHALSVFSDRVFAQLSSDAAQAPEDLPLPHHSAIRALALGEICRVALAATHKGPGTAADVTFVIHAEDPGVVRTHDGERVDSYTAQVAVCDAAFHPVVFDRFGVAVDLGREQRFGSRDQRRASRVRDGGCVFPGCDAPSSRTDLHHVDPWVPTGSSSTSHHPDVCSDSCHHTGADDTSTSGTSTDSTSTGGRTDMDNLASLCRHHHGVVHRTGWAMRTVEHQWFEFTTPTGAVLGSQRHGRPMPAAA